MAASRLVEAISDDQRVCEPRAFRWRKAIYDLVVSGISIGNDRS